MEHTDDTGGERAYRLIKRKPSFSEVKGAKVTSIKRTKGNLTIVFDSGHTIAAKGGEVSLAKTK